MHRHRYFAPLSDDGPPPLAVTPSSAKGGAFSSAKGGSFSSAKGGYFSSVKGGALSLARAERLPHTSHPWWVGSRVGLNSIGLYRESELLKKRGKKDKFIPGHGKESALMNDLDKEVPNPKVLKEECPAHVEEVSILKRHKDVGKHGENYISERIKESALMNDLDKKVPNPKVSKEECPAHVEEVSILKHHKDVGKHGDNYISERIKEESVFLKKCGKVPSQKEESVFLKKCGKVPSQKVTKEECIAGYLQINEDIPLHVMVDMKIGIRDIILIYQAEGFEENVRDLRNSLSRNMQPKDTKVAHALINACKASMGINSYWNEVKLETVVSLFLLIAKLATVLGAKPGQILDLSKAEIQTLGNSESATVGYCSKGSV